MKPDTILYIYSAIIVVMSVIGYFAFLIDKSKAVHGKPRIKEKTLLTICAVGGALGCAMSRNINRHKTDKIYFTIVIGLSLFVQLVTLTILVLLAF